MVTGVGDVQGPVWCDGDASGPGVGSVTALRHSVDLINGQFYHARLVRLRGWLLIEAPDEDDPGHLSRPQEDPAISGEDQGSDREWSRQTGLSGAIDAQN